MGRSPAINNDESVRECRFFITNSFFQMDDIRLVSSVELTATRARAQRAMNPPKGPVRPEEIAELEKVRVPALQDWYQYWDSLFSVKYEECGESQSSFGTSMSFDFLKLSVLPRESTDTTYPHPPISKCNLLERCHPKERPANAARPKAASNAINRSGKSCLIHYSQFNIL